MNSNNDTRKNLIDEINKTMFSEENKGCVKASEIADFIINRERNIINPLVICLENSKNTPDFVKSYAFLANGIVETLKRAGLNS